MNGRLVVTYGSQGWGNRKSGCESYGPGGRWAGPRELPHRANKNVLFGDLLGDHLDELGAGEGSPFIVIASTSRFDTEFIHGLLDPDHYIEFRDDGWTIAHPLIERVDGSLFDCPFSQWKGGDPGVRGRFVLNADGRFHSA